VSFKESTPQTLSNPVNSFFLNELIYRDEMFFFSSIFVKIAVG